jgi:hypothetical protein
VHPVKLIKTEGTWTMTTFKPYIVAPPVFDPELTGTEPLDEFGALPYSDAYQDHKDHLAACMHCFGTCNVEGGVDPGNLCPEGQACWFAALGMLDFQRYTAASN